MSHKVKNEILGIDASRYPVSDNVTGVELYTKKIIDGILEANLPFQIRLYTRRKINFNRKVEQVVIKRKYLWTKIGLSSELGRHPVDRLFIPSHTLPKNFPEKTFIVIHGLEASHFPAAYSHFQRFYQRWSTSAAVRNAKKLLAVSEAVKKDLINFYKCPSQKIKVVHNGFDPKEFTIPKNKTGQINLVLKEYGLNPDDKFILNIGRIEERKNQYRLILAFRKFLKTHPSWKLVLAGPAGYKGSMVKRLAKKMDLSDNIVFLGFVPHHDIKYLLHSAKIFAFPSLAEGFGFPVLEAFACNAPVLTSNTSCLPEIAGNGALLVNPLSVLEINEGLNTLAENKNLIKKLQTNAKTRLDEFIWKKCISETIQAITTS